MNNRIIISEAVTEDAREITLIRRKTWIETYANEKEGITREDIEAVLNNRTIEEETSQRKIRMLNDRNFKTWVAKDNGVVIGFADAQKKEDMYRIGPFYILPDYQKQGTGSDLMKLALAWLGNDKEIHFEVIAYNSQAIAFYKKFGFVENGVTHYEPVIFPNGREMPQIEMIKKQNDK
jgi:GNAT superfamily N-acetyltransferase